jgi:hypothetical protein
VSQIRRRDTEQAAEPVEHRRAVVGLSGETLPVNEDHLTRPVANQHPTVGIQHQPARRRDDNRCGAHGTGELHRLVRIEHLHIPQPTQQGEHEARHEDLDKGQSS